MKNILLSFLLFLAFPSACFAEFPDVNENTDYHYSILYAQENGLVKGYEDGLFRPYKDITRAEFTKVIIEAVFSDEEIESCDTSEIDFTDVDKDNWAMKYICVAKKHDIVRGFNDGSFLPSRLINFAEASKIITLAFDIEIERSFEDLYWYYPYVNALVERKAIPTTLGLPVDNLNRSEMVYIMYLLRENIEGTDYKVLFHNRLWDYRPDLVDLGFGYVKYEGKIHNAPPISLLTVDVDSFEALSEHYAKDRFHAYYYNITADTFYIDGADIDTFKALNDVYAKDKNNVYFEGRILEGADPETFELVDMVFPEFELARDDNENYDGYLEYLEWERSLSINYHFPMLAYAKDKNNAYYTNIVLYEVDLDSLVAYVHLPYMERYLPYAKDLSSVYIRGAILSTDASNFELFSWLYSKDSEFVYFGDKKIDGADPESFVSTNYWDEGKDKNCEYIKEEPVNCISL